MRGQVVQEGGLKVTEIVNNLTETVAGKALDATQGKVLKDSVDAHKADEATLNQLGHIYHATLTTTLDTIWTGTEAPYSKTQTVTGLVANDNPIIDVVMSGNFEVDKEQANEWSKIYRITTADNSITLYATNKPTVGLPIQLKVVR